jgi:hypothetical protein
VFVNVCMRYMAIDCKSFIEATIGLPMGDFKMIPCSFLLLHSLILLSIISMFLPSSSISVFIPSFLYLPPSLFLTACLYLFLCTSFFPSFLLLSNFCLHTYFMFLLPRLPFFLPSCISLFPRCSLLNSIFCRPSSFFLTLVLLFLFPPDGDALALL